MDKTQIIINNIMNLPYNPTILISTHRTNHLLKTNKVCVIVDGKLAALVQQMRSQKK